MVTRFWRFIFFGLFIFAPSKSHAVFSQTRRDLEVLEDRLKYELIEDEGRIKPGAIPQERLTPVLVAPPEAYWQESKSDFSPLVREKLAHLFPNPGDLINCPQCAESRVYVSSDNRMVVSNGEIGLGDLARLRALPGYGSAKSILFTRETPSGIEVRLLAVEDARILYAGVVDSTKTLDQVERPLRLAREMDRRARGEALSYFAFDAGIYPQGMAQMRWLEQWGDRNQHLSGLAIGLYNPTGAIGVNYQYLLPRLRRATVGITAYYSISSVFKSADASQGFVGQGSLNYAISGAYGVFAAADTQGVVTVGLSLQNPVFLPFLF